MARIPTYTIDTVFNDNDLLLGTDGSTTALETKNFKIGGLKDYIIDQFVDPDASDFFIPVFHNSGTKITDSIISQNIYPNGTSILISGDLGVSGNIGGVNITGTGTLAIGGEAMLTKKVTIQGADGGSGILKLNCENNSHGVHIQGPPHSAGANYTLILPNDTGSAGQQLTTDGTGVLSWSAGSAITGSGTAGRISMWDGTNSLTDSPIRKTVDATGANVLNFQDALGSGSKVSFGLPGGIYLGANAGQADPAVNAAGTAQYNFNIGIGDDALLTQVIGVNPVTGANIPGENIGIGHAALKQTSSGTNNIAIASGSLASNTTGYNNVAISKNALGSVVNQAQNITNNITSIGIGFSAGNPSVNQPTPIGHDGDIFIGHQSGADQVYSNSTKNVFLGYRAGRNSGNVNSILNSAENVVIGAQAGLNIDGPDGSPLPFSRNIFIGKNAGHSAFGSNIQDNIILGSRGTDPLYLKAGNVVFHTGGFGNNIGIPNNTNVDGGVSNNFVLGSNISVYGSQNIILNPNRSTDSSTGISVGESDFRPTTGIWDDDFSKNVIIGGGETPGIKISASGVGQNTTQNTQNTIINSGSVWSPSDVQYTGIQLESNSIYDVKNNTILGSNDIYLKTNMGTTTNGNQIRGNTFINSDGILIEGKFEGNTIINYKGSNFTPNVNFNVGTPASPTSSAGTSNNFIIGKYGSTSTDYQVYVGASNNILGPLGQGVEVMGDGNLLFGVSNIKLFNDSNANLAFGQNITAGTDTPGGEAGNRRAQRSLLFGFNIDVANNQSLQNSLVGGSNTTFDSGNTTQIQNAIAVGSGLIGAGSNSAHFGKNNEATTSSLLTIGCGAGTSNRANALEVRDDASSIPGRAVVYLHQTELQNYATQADATAAGLSNGAIYHTDGTLKIVY